MTDASPGVRLRSACPVFLVSDIASTMRWYRENLGFGASPHPPSPPHVFCVLHRDRVEIMLQHLAGYEKPDLFEKRRGGVWDAYLRMQGVRELYETVSKLPDVRVIEPLRRQPYGDTEFVVRDPNGYVLVFSEGEWYGD